MTVLYIVIYILDYIQQSRDVSLGNNSAVAFYPSLLCIRFNVETTVTVQCQCFIDQHFICGRLTAQILNSALEGDKCLTSRHGRFTSPMNSCIQ
jgi:hypothetical protein